MKWLEVSFDVSGELVEPIVDLLTRVASVGASITNEPGEAGPDPVLFTVAAYLPDDNQLEPVKRRIEEGIWHLSRISPIPSPVYRVVEEEDWATTWRQNYRPIAVGRRLLIQPAWLDSPADGERLAILIEPGMAFGTGMHPTTRLSLSALEDYLRPGMSVADIGCGSGILSIAAGLLGAGSLLCLDVDPIAVEVTEKNIEANRLGESAQVVLGSLPELRQTVTGSGRGYDILVANILLDVLIGMIDEGAADCLAPEGVMILSGILDVQEGELLAACETAGLAPVESRAEADWRALIVKRTPPRSAGGGENY